MGLIKLLIGTGHTGIEELERVKARVREDCLLVGLELPEDYEKKERLGVTYFFFTPLAHYFQSRGATIVPLEKPELLDIFYPLNCAKAVLEGKCTREVVERKLKGLEKEADSYYAAPEQVYSARLGAQRYRDAIRLLDEGIELADIPLSWEIINAQREAYMLKKILDYSPSVVIVGMAHAKVLKLKLPEYMYVVSI